MYHLAVSAAEHDRPLSDQEWADVVAECTPDGYDHPAPDTFSTKTAAERWLAAVETDLGRGQWVDPRARQLLLSDYAVSWLAGRPDLKIRTRELYRWLLNKYVLPQLGDLPLDKITPTIVRAWHAALLRDGSPTPAHASMRAALIYQHASADRDAAIAAALSRLAAGEAVAEPPGQIRPPMRAQGRARPRATGT